MAAMYGDAPDCRHTTGYLSRWPARERFLSELYELAPQAHEELLDPVAVASVLEPARLLVTHSPQPLPISVERLLFSREDGLLKGMDWASGDIHLHSDFHRLNPKDAALVTKILHRMGRERIASLWADRQVEQIDLHITIADYLRSQSSSDDDGEIFMRSVRDIVPTLEQHLRHWAEQFNLSAPWMLMVGGITILEAARTPSNPPQGYVTPGRDWRAWYQNFNETFFDAATLAVDIHDSWNPRNESRSSALERITASVAAKLARIEDKVQATSQRLAQKTQPEHFTWLVRYQVLSQSYGAIAKEAHRDEASVSGGVKRTAALIELPLRVPTRAGRPRKV